MRSKPRPEDQIQYTIAEKKDKRAVKAHVNAVFFRQLKELLRKLFTRQVIQVFIWKKEDDDDDVCSSKA